MKNLIKIFSGLILCLGISTQALAQNIGINTTGAVPDSSAALDISSSTQGLLIPRMDSTARKNISNPAKGLMVYDSTYNQFYFYNGTLWSAFTGDTGNDNLGNHIARQNLQLNNNWLNNDGGTNEGIRINNNGQLGVGTAPSATFHVSMGAGNAGFRVTDTLIHINDYSLPVTDGTSGQILSSDGAGNVSWSNTSGTDAQDLSLSGNTLSLTNDATTVDLSSYLDNTDAQDLSISGNTLSLTNDATTVDLSSYLDNTDAQDLSLSGSTLSLTNDATTVDLSSYSDNTDAQDLSISGNTLSLSNDATAVDLSSYLDNTDAQDLSLSGGILSLTNDGTTVDLNPITTTDDLGNHIATQQLQLNDNWLNNDGGTEEGIWIDNLGRVGIDTIPAASFHVNMNGLKGFQVDSTGVTINQYTLPIHDGAPNQVLTSDGIGNVNWTTPAAGGGSPDDMGNHTAIQNVQLNGNWLSNDGGNEGILIDNDGKVGIGRGVGSIGSAKLEYYGASGSTAGPHIQFVNSGDDYPLFQQLNWGFDNIALGFDAYFDGQWRSSSNISNFVLYKFGATLTNFYSNGNALGTSFTLSTGTILTAAGRFGIGMEPTTNLLEVDGNASKTTAGNWLANSDARLKKNISPLSSQEMLNKLLALKGVTYEWEDNKTGTQRPEGIQYGFTAQNIQEVFPSLVSTDNQGFLQTPYGTYDAMTVEAIRALNEKIEQLEKGTARLQSKAQDLERKSQQLDNQSAAMAELKAFYAELESMVDEKVNSTDSSLESEK